MKLFWRKLLIFISFLLVFSVNLSALDILENYNYGKGAVFLESKGERTITLGKYIRILEDKDRSLNADDIFSGNFDQTFKPTKKYCQSGPCGNVWIELFLNQQSSGILL